MLFSLTKSAAPEGLSATAKPKFVALSLAQPVNSTDFPWDYNVFVRYLTLVDANADSNRDKVFTTYETFFRDDEELTAGTTYYYRAYWVDEWGNESILADAVNVAWKKVTDADVDLPIITGSIDAVVADLATEVAARSADTAAAVAAAIEASGRYRSLVSQVRDIAVEATNQGLTAFSQKEELRQTLTARIGANYAEFDQRIITAASDTSALAARTTTLEAGASTMSAQINTVDLARISGDSALAAQIAAISVGTDNQFDYVDIWYFDSTVEGWTGNGTPTQSGSSLRPADHATDPYVISPSGLGVPATTYTQVRARVQKVGSPTWEGYCWWKAVGDGTWDSARRTTISAPTFDGAGYGLITFNNAWAGTIDQIRLDLSTAQTTTDYFLIDWVAIGRPSPGASSAELLTEQAARISGDNANAASITDLSASLTTAQGDITGLSTAVSALETDVSTLDGTVTSQGTAITGLTTSLSGKADVTTVDALQNEIDDFGGSAGVLATGAATRAIRNQLDPLATLAADSAMAAFLQAMDIRNVTATASQLLGTRIDVNSAGIDLLSQSVTALQAAIPGLATADALSLLTTRVSATETSITSLSTFTTSLSTTVAGKADSTALTALTTRVTTAEGNISTINGQITSLNSTVAGKADSSALSALATEVTDIDGRVTSSATAITDLSAGQTGGDVATANFKMAVSTGDAGYASKISLQARTGGAGTWRDAGLTIDVPSVGNTQITMEADKFVFRTGTTKKQAFTFSGTTLQITGNVDIGNADITNLTISGTLNIIDATIVDGKFDTTSPTAPGTPTIASTAADLDKDGDIDAGLTVSWTAPASGRAPKKYHGEIWRRKGDKGADGNNVTGYSLWQSFYTNKLSKTFKANANYFHKAQITPITVNEVEGTPSAYTTVGVQPNIYSNTMPTVAWQASNPIVAKPKAIWLRIVQIDLAAYPHAKEIVFYRNTVNNSGTATEIGTAPAGAQRYIDNDDLVAGTTYYYWAKVRDKSNQVSASFSAVQSVAWQLIQDADTDQTAPNAPGTPSLASITADIDKDGSLDAGLMAAWTAPGSGRAPKRYRIEIWRRKGDKGTDGNNVTGYTFWKNVNADNLSETFKANANYFHKCRVIPITTNGVEGTPSAYTTVGVAPDGLATSGMPTPTTVFFETAGHGVYNAYVAWSGGLPANYAYTRVLIGTVNNKTSATLLYTGISANGTDIRVPLPNLLPFTQYWLWAENVDNTGAAGGSYPPNTAGSGTFTPYLLTADISDNAINDSFSSFTNTSQVLSAGVKTLVESIICGHGTGANLVEIWTQFKNVSGASKTIDVSIEDASGNVYRSITAVIPDNGFLFPFAKITSPSGLSTTVRLYLTIAGGGTINNTVIFAQARKR